MSKQNGDVSKSDGNVTVTTEVTEGVNVKSDDLNKTNDGQTKHGKKRKADDSVGDMEVESNEHVSVKKSKKKKKNNVSDNIAALDNESVDTNVKSGNEIAESTVNDKTNSGETVVPGKTDGSKKKKKKNKKNKSDRKLEMSEERLKAYGINPKRYKYMKKEELHQIKPREKKEKQP